ncbi:hypothetical protein [Alteromonas oceani]|uniref:hypothetical protein n=1 Tax=Alteromonas oceani TaxID=2071609 RepID=UPI0013DD8A5F|nr:hypothetical protein [Alteromonas oceani]
MNRKIVINCVLIALGICTCFWAWHLFTSGHTDYRRHPLYLFGLGVLLVLWSIKDLTLLLINPVIQKKYPRVYERLNGDIWTFLLGPVKDKNET